MRQTSSWLMAGALALGATTSSCAMQDAVPEPLRPYDDSLMLLGEFRGHADADGMHIDAFVQSDAAAAALADLGVNVEPLTMLMNASGFGRGNNPPSSYEIVTCQPAASPPCELQYGPRVAFGFGAEADRCGTTPAGRSSRCYSADTELRMFFGSGVEVQNVYLLFNNFQSAGAPYDLRPYDGTEAVLGLTGNIGDVYRYGTIESLDGFAGPGTPAAPSLDAPFHQATVRRWRFSLPEGAPEDPTFFFSGQVYGTLTTAPRAPYQASVRGSGAATAEPTSGGCLSSTSDFAVFGSRDPLLPSHPAGTSQVYRVRRRTGEVELISRASSGAPGDGDSSSPCISADGSVVVFESTSTNLATAPDTNGVRDVFVRDVAAATTELISHPVGGGEATQCGRGGGSNRPRVSSNGFVVAFSSTCASLCGGSSQTTGCFAGRRQVYRFGRTAGVLEGVSVRSGTPGTIGPSTLWGGAGAPLTAGTHNSHLGGINFDGDRVAFVSSAFGEGSLTAVADTATRDVFVRLAAAGETARISDDRGGAVGSRNPVLSNDGVWVAFETASSTLGAGDANGRIDIIRCLATSGSCGLVSTPDGVSTPTSDGDSINATLSGDGRYLAYESAATNLVAGDTNGVTDIFVRDLVGTTVRLVSRNGSGALGDAASGRPSFSMDGAYVMFESAAANLMADPAGNFDTDGGAVDVFVVRR